MPSPNEPTFEITYTYPAFVNCALRYCSLFCLGFRQSSLQTFDLRTVLILSRGHCPGQSLLQDCPLVVDPCLLTLNLSFEFLFFSNLLPECVLAPLAETRHERPFQIQRVIRRCGAASSSGVT